MPDMILSPIPLVEVVHTTNTYSVNFGQDSTFNGDETAGTNSDENGTRFV